MILSSKYFTLRREQFNYFKCFWMRCYKVKPLCKSMLWLWYKYIPVHVYSKAYYILTRKNKCIYVHSFCWLSALLEVNQKSNIETVIYSVCSAIILHGRSIGITMSVYLLCSTLHFTLFFPIEIFRLEIITLIWKVKKWKTQNGGKKLMYA